MIYEYFRVTRFHEVILDFSDPFSLISRGDDVQGFDTRWDEGILSTHEVPSDKILESIFGRLVSSKLCWHYAKNLLNRRTHNQATRD